MGEKEQIASASSGVPPAQYMELKRAVEALAMASGPRPLNEPLAELVVMAVYAGALIAAGGCSPCC